MKNFSPQLLGVNLRKTFLCLGLAFISVIFLTSNFSDKEFERVFDLTLSKFCTFPSSLLITLSRFLSTSFGKLKPKSKIFKNSNICKYKKGEGSFYVLLSFKFVSAIGHTYKLDPYKNHLKLSMPKMNYVFMV